MAEVFGDKVPVVSDWLLSLFPHRLSFKPVALADEVTGKEWRLCPFFLSNEAVLEKVVDDDDQVPEKFVLRFAMVLTGHPTSSLPRGVACVT